jgi:hypothetical protein
VAIAAADENEKKGVYRLNMCMRIHIIDIHSQVINKCSLLVANVFFMMQLEPGEII